MSQLNLTRRLSMKDRIYYRGYHLKQLTKLPLGGLIDEFERRNECDALIKKLKTIQGERNFFAHKGYLLSTEEKEEDMKALLERLANGLAEAGDCLKEVAIETCKITGEALPKIPDSFHCDVDTLSFD